MFLFVCSYLIELEKERCVKYLDIDNDYPDNYLLNKLSLKKEIQINTWIK